jgi:glucose-6-phosphate-specific signal transduction histidine kinase
MVYYWGISLALSEILPELAFILIPIGLLFYLLPYWHVILGATLVVFMWVHWDSLHW